MRNNVFAVSFGGSQQNVLSQVEINVVQLIFVSIWCLFGGSISFYSPSTDQDKIHGWILDSVSFSTSEPDPYRSDMDMQQRVKFNFCLHLKNISE